MTPPSEALQAVEAREAALENLVGTYEAIGLALEGSFRLEGEGYRGILSPVRHGAGNFALARAPGAHAARELATIARERPELFVYLLPGEGESAGAEALRRAGFRILAVQAVMARPPDVLELPRRTRLIEATALPARVELMDFLTKQFFEFQPRDFRMHLAVATARAESCRLWEIRDRRLRVAGAMTITLGGVYGLYDVAVRDGFRGGGLGSELVEDLLARVPPAMRLATLQCLRPLVSWYGRYGFKPVGDMTTFVWNEG